MTQLAEARVAKDHLRDELRACPEVVAVGLTKRGGDYRIKVEVAEETDAVPETVDGVDVVVSVVGHIRAQGA